jgi:hypothetical protein
MKFTIKAAHLAGLLVPMLTLACAGVCTGSGSDIGRCHRAGDVIVFPQIHQRDCGDTA